MRTGGVAFGRLPIDVGLPYKKLKPYEHLTQRYHMPEKNVVCTVETIIRVDFLLIRLGFCRNFPIFGAKEIFKK